MAITGNYQNERIEKNRSFFNKFQLWPENSTNWISDVSEEWGETVMLSMESGQWLLPQALAESTALPTSASNLISKVLHAQDPVFS